MSCKFWYACKEYSLYFNRKNTSGSNVYVEIAKNNFESEYNYNNEYRVFRKDGESITLLDIRKRKTFDLNDL